MSAEAGRSRGANWGARDDRELTLTWSFRAAPLLVAGPCVVEEGDVLARVADRIAAIRARLGIPVCLKASFDKANRARLGAPRGPGLEAGLEALATGETILAGFRS